VLKAKFTLVSKLVQEGPKQPEAILAKPQH
jgi:hypothetical protein